MFLNNALLKLAEKVIHLYSDQLLGICEEVTLQRNEAPIIEFGDSVSESNA